MPDRPAAADAAFMRRALELAERGWGRTWPNPLVGAVLVREGVVVGEGWHAEYGGPHAEAAALAAAGDRARGATAYVTLEPCAHWGKTPPCADALAAAGVARVVFAAADPSPHAGGGAERLRRAGVEVAAGVERAAARDQNAPFFHVLERGSPYVALKYALSLDARLSREAGRPTPVTGAEARAEVHRLRAGYDAIVVGIGTVLADDPLLTVRGPVEPRVAPARVVLDADLRIPLTSRLVRSTDEAPVWVVCAEDVEAGRRAPLEAAGVRVLPVPRASGGVDVHAALGALRDAGARSLFVEGGGRVGAALLAVDAVEEMLLFYAPALFGERGTPAFPGVVGGAEWRLGRTRAFGDDVLISLRRARPEPVGE
ncbi:MAG TPA: bifunctional diaminohydroxyphosphoribosylaminopyrimidine deaminase/5-amino-6-(5-phosphoribosylamino)uracil reductase RibD [Longimicrobiales bacterium]|nr:bifunctional diaminohydroxyphosphoribosylaminopyrimidine deaminase/5-amino-6-(5-phosphoribosylamino)uracil reductase RibD [Longimicrobiales bacterium]